MRWEDRVFAMFEDLELQAEGLHLEQRLSEVEALGEADYAEVTLASRLHASVGRRVRIVLRDSVQVAGRLVRVGQGWVLVDSDPALWLVQVGAVVHFAGLSQASVPPELWPLTAGLSVRAAVRRISGAAQPCVVWLVGGAQCVGTLGRVGADFVELQSATGDLVIPLGRVAAVQGTQ